MSNKTPVKYNVRSYKASVIELSPEIGGGYEASFPQFDRAVTAVGETPEEALAKGYETLADVFDSWIEIGDPIPEPEAEPNWTQFSGHFSVRTSRLLHYEIDTLARAQNTSLNSMVGSLLQQAVNQAKVQRRADSAAEWFGFLSHIVAAKISAQTADFGFSSVFDVLPSFGENSKILNYQQKELTCA